MFEFQIWAKWLRGQFNIPKWTWLPDSPYIPQYLPVVGSSCLPYPELSSPGSWAVLSSILVACSVCIFVLLGCCAWFHSLPSPFPSRSFLWLRLMITPYSPRCPCSCLWLSSSTHVFPISLLCHSGSRNVAVMLSFLSFLFSFLFYSKIIKENTIR